MHKCCPVDTLAPKKSPAIWEIFLRIKRLLYPTNKGEYPMRTGGTPTDNSARPTQKILFASGSFQIGDGGLELRGEFFAVVGLALEAAEADAGLHGIFAEQI